MKKGSFIHWYPGHIAKAEKQLKEKLNLCDVVVEVLDARIPISSMYNNIQSLLGGKPRLILLNKSDLTDMRELKLFTDKIKKEVNVPVIVTDSKNFKDLNVITKKILELAEPKIQALMAKGLLRRPARVMVVGMPNVGKSSIINKLTKTSKTKTGAKAGVTRQQQWVRINKDIDLLDTPGIIPMRQDNQEAAAKLAFVNSVSENAYDNETVAQELLNVLSKKYSEQLLDYYKVEDLTLENIARSKNWLISNSNPDTERTAAFVLKYFREGKLGKFILDDLEQTII